MDSSAFRIRVVDYIGNLGGGLRFTTEIVRNILDQSDDVVLELVSHGPPLERYRKTLGRRSRLTFRDLQPDSRPLVERFRRMKGGQKILAALGDANFHVRVPSAVFRDVGAVWFPWLHRHRLSDPRQLTRTNVVASFHDAIMLERADIVSRGMRLDEWRTTQIWFASKAQVVASSQSTVATTRRLGLARASRAVDVIPVGADHIRRSSAPSVLPASFAQPTGPFLFYPANTSPHKNHELLIDAVAELKGRARLVLTGDGTDFSKPGRAAFLRARAEERGLSVGVDVIGLGYVDDEVVRGLLESCAALVMPSLAEGGGSFPVLEAMAVGVPVVCSDIPVMKEQLQRTGGSVLWFDPSSTMSLADKLLSLLDNSEEWSHRARAQASGLQLRAWRQVALDYVDRLRRGRALRS